MSPAKAGLFFWRRSGGTDILASAARQSGSGYPTDLAAAPALFALERRVDCALEQIAISPNLNFFLTYCFDAFS